MKKEGGDEKFGQISSIFSQFSEENKKKLLKMAKKLLKVQKEGGTTIMPAQNGDIRGKRCCRKKQA